MTTFFRLIGSFLFGFGFWYFIFFFLCVEKDPFLWPVLTKILYLFFSILSMNSVFNNVDEN
jgi:hypothetical protein